jgi:hypothetical protein
MTPFVHCLTVPTENLEIPLRYYKGWTIIFKVKDESFNCPMLQLFGFSSGKDLEKAMDFAILKRG